MPDISPPFAIACGGGDKGAEDGPLELTFDGTSCRYTGPTELEAGPVQLVFVNDSSGVASVNLLILDEGKTIEDVIDYNGPEPTTKHAPP